MFWAGQLLFNVFDDVWIETDHFDHIAFYFFFRLFHLSVLFRLPNMKRLSSTCLFKLIKVNEKTSTQYNFNPFLYWARMSMKKECLIQTWLRGSPDYCFLSFRTQETIYEKEPLEFFFFHFFKLFKHEKGVELYLCWTFKIFK